MSVNRKSRNANFLQNGSLRKRLLDQVTKPSSKEYKKKIRKPKRKIRLRAEAAKKKAAIVITKSKSSQKRKVKFSNKVKRPKGVKKLKTKNKWIRK